MVKQITVRWQPPAQSHAYAQVIPHATVHVQHLYAARRIDPIDLIPPAPDSRKRPPSAPAAAVPSKRAASPIPQRTDPPHSQSMPAAIPMPRRPSSGAPAFTSPTSAAVRASRARLGEIERQLAELRSVTSASSKEARRALQAQRAHLTALEQQDVIDGRHDLCTAPEQLRRHVHRLLGPDWARREKVYGAVHAQPVVAEQEHEQSRSIDQRNAAVPTAPFVFYSSQLRFPAEKPSAHPPPAPEEQKEQVEVQVEAVESKKAKRRGEPPRARKATRERRERLAAASYKPTERPRETRAQRVSATEKAAAPVRQRRPNTAGLRPPSRPAPTSPLPRRAGSPLPSHQRPTSPPPRRTASPQPPPPPSSPPRAASPPHPLSPPGSHPWLSWRTGPGSSGTQAVTSQQSGTVLTIGPALWGDVRVAGEAFGKGRVRRRTVEEEWQWRERERRERRRREALKDRAAEESPLLREMEAAIRREKEKAAEARSAVRAEDRKADAIRHRIHRAEEEERQRPRPHELRQPERDALYEHPFVHPVVPPSTAGSGRVRSRPQRRSSPPPPPPAPSSPPVPSVADVLAISAAPATYMRRELHRAIERYQAELDAAVKALEKEEKKLTGARTDARALEVARRRREVEEKRAELAAVRRQLAEIRDGDRRTAPLPTPTRRSVSARASQPAVRDERPRTASSVKTERPRTASAVAKATQVPDSAMAAVDERRELELSIERDIADMMYLLKLRIQHTSASASPPEALSSPPSSTAPAPALAAQAEVEEVREGAVEHVHEHHYIPVAPATRGVDAEDDVMMRKHEAALAAIRSRKAAVAQAAEGHTVYTAESSKDERPAAGVRQPDEQSVPHHQPPRAPMSP